MVSIATHREANRSVPPKDPGSGDTLNLRLVLQDDILDTSMVPEPVRPISPSDNHLKITNVYEKRWGIEDVQEAYEEGRQEGVSIAKQALKESFQSGGYKALSLLSIGVGIFTAGHANVAFLAEHYGTGLLYTGVVLAVAFTAKHFWDQSRAVKEGE